MDDATFWGLIDAARKADDNADAERLRGLMASQPDEAVRGFARAFAEQMARLNRWSVWGAAYVAQGGASDDGFLYFCEGLVGKGRAAVEQALADPDGLAPFLSTDPEANENEGLGAVAHDVLRDRGIETDPSSYPSEPPSGEPFDEEAVDDAYPRLAAAFG